MEIEEVSCEAAGCYMRAIGEGYATGLGWEVVNGSLYCPSHAGPAGFAARREAQMEALNRRANEIEAKRSLDPGFYRAWDEFQSDLVNFQRANGRPAHRELRIMTPHDFKARYRQSGRIDIANATWAIETAERAFTDKTNERYKGI